VDSEPRERGVDAWDQHAWVWDAAFYSLLGLTTLLALVDPDGAGDRWRVAGLALATAGWHLRFQRLGVGERRPWLAIAYLAGLASLWFPLAGLHPAYFSLLLVMYPQVFRYLRLALAVPAAVALTVQVVVREVLTSGQPLSDNLPAVAGGLVSVIFGCLFAFWLTRIIDQSAERRLLIEQLEATRSELAAATAEITARFPATRVLVLTTYDTDADILRAVEAGATGYLLKDTPRERLFPAIRSAARGETVLAPTVATRLVRRMRRPASEALTSREVEVLELVARGASNADIAAALFISEATVKTHLLHAYAKLGVDDRTAAVVAALERGIIALPRRRS
jgi:DNA-binding NarL/FixJ family response regulator